MQVTFRCFADIRHFFLGSGFLSYCNQSTGGAGDSFTVFPGLMPSIFIWFIVKRQIYLLYLVTPQRQCSFVKAKPLVLLEHNSFPCLMWQRVFLRSDNTGSVVSWGKVKYVLYTFFFFKLIFGFLFSKCFFSYLVTSISLFSFTCQMQQFRSEFQQVPGESSRNWWQKLSR